MTKFFPANLEQTLNRKLALPEEKAHAFRNVDLPQQYGRRKFLNLYGQMKDSLGRNYLPFGRTNLLFRA
jgi:hypothetical protein